jgi:hypothetical protein
MKRLPLVCLLVPLAAAAQVAPVPPPAQVGLDDDPHIDRVWFSPTAITQPAGTASFNDWELILLGFTYGVSDQFQLTAMVVPPLFEDMPFIGMASAKYSVPLGERVHVAPLAGVGYASVDDDSGFALGAGGALSLCITEDCGSLVSAFVYAVWFLEETDDAFPVAFGASLLARVSRHIKLALEVGSGGVLSRADSQLAEGVVVSYGVRFFSGNLAGDVGFVRPFVFDGDDFADELILGVPAVTFSYRWGGRGGD